MKTQKKEKPYLQSRPPIVVVLGHVDHGKTTLLDKIRKTTVAQKEAGGITQSIGASQVVTSENKKITFIDTPGHAAFSKMRSRGAKVADIAILVVAAHGGIKPQTLEALRYIQEADIPYIVAATKIDLPSASIETVREQLKKEGVKFENEGGDVVLVPVSGLTGEGVENLLEIISLVSEVNEIKGDENAALEAIVIETQKDRRGPLVSVIVRNGSLKVSDQVVSDNLDAKIKGLFDNKGKPISKVVPGQPAQILGFSQLPKVGSSIVIKTDEYKGNIQKQTILPKTVKEGQIPIVIKTDSNGSLEAILENLPKEIVVISSGVGDVNEGDIFFAKSAKNAMIITFRSKVSQIVKKLAVTEGIKIQSFEIIYELLDRLNELIEDEKEEILGEAEIITSFPFENKRVAGCKIISGKISKKDNIQIIRGEKELGKVRIVSMKKQKQNIDLAKIGEEFGVIFEPQLDFKAKDMLISIR
ncbi:hypothetical protein A2Z22_05040 [Candidatus Woesebacteria bacterium RBG_16_34_12]|uniref:Tr-type G domain-containing protein n=1 Tax=Candidatus Woesebacteria bacterium RBG_16_34_12 TaxID=1802480 RepID=A0A1F7XAE0_9BACT|nr:MAG: hypothetical protein A2Z22_05040 [Candidatus Woesebacteria bacterium RBG_16_34_12]